MFHFEKNNPKIDIKNAKQNFLFGALALFFEILISFIIASIVKLIIDEVSLIVILLFRYVFCLPLLILMGFISLGNKLFFIKQKQILILRSITGLLGLVLWLLSVIYLKISLATALFQTMPIFITIMAPFILYERVGVHRISAIFFGFFGVLILIYPDLKDLNNLNFFPGLFFGFLCPAVCALMFIFLRKSSYEDSPISTSIWYNSFGVCVFSFLSIYLNVSFPPLNKIWIILIACGVLASFQQYFLALSHYLASASSLAIVQFLAIPLSVLIGIIIFDEKITFSFLMGASILVLANYYIYLREKKISFNNTNVRFEGD